MELMKKCFCIVLSFIVTCIPIILLFWIVSAGALSFSGDVSENIFELNTTGDVLILTMLLLSAIFTNLCFYFLKNKGGYSKNPLQAIVGVLNDEMLLLAIIPISVLGIDKSVNSVEIVVNNTEFFYVTSVVVMSLGILILILILRDRIRHNIWWLFLIAAPHIMIGWMLKADYQGFKAFINNPDFSYKKVAEMLNDANLNLAILNPSWFKCLAVMILILILVIGLIIYEFLWKKTETWRIKYD